MFVRKIEYKIKLTHQGISYDTGILHSTFDILIDVYFTNGTIAKDIPIVLQPAPAFLNNTEFGHFTKLEVLQMLSGHKNDFTDGVWSAINKLLNETNNIKITGCLLKVDSEDIKVVNVDTRICRKQV